MDYVGWMSVCSRGYMKGAGEGWSDILVQVGGGGEVGWLGQRGLIYTTGCQFPL